MTARPPTALLAEELAAMATTAGADEVRIWVEDSRSAEYRTSHDDAVTQRSGTRRRVTVALRLGERWTTELVDGGAPPAAAPPVAPPVATPARLAEQVRETVLDPCKYSVIPWEGMPGTRPVVMAGCLDRLGFVPGSRLR